MGQCQLVVDPLNQCGRPEWTKTKEKTTVFIILCRRTLENVEDDDKRKEDDSSEWNENAYKKKKKKKQLTIVNCPTALDAHGAAAHDNASTYGLLGAEVVDGQGGRVHDAAQTDVHEGPRRLHEVAIGVEVSADVVGHGTETSVGAVQVG